MGWQSPKDNNTPMSPKSDHYPYAHMVKSKTSPKIVQRKSSYSFDLQPHHQNPPPLHLPPPPPLPHPSSSPRDASRTSTPKKFFSTFGHHKPMDPNLNHYETIPTATTTASTTTAPNNCLTSSSATSTSHGGGYHQNGKKSENNVKQKNIMDSVSCCSAGGGGGGSVGGRGGNSSYSSCTSENHSNLTYKNRHIKESTKDSLASKSSNNKHKQKLIMSSSTMAPNENNKNRNNPLDAYDMSEIRFVNGHTGRALKTESKYGKILQTNRASTINNHDKINANCPPIFSSSSSPSSSASNFKAVGGGSSCGSPSLGVGIRNENNNNNNTNHNNNNHHNNGNVLNNNIFHYPPPPPLPIPHEHHEHQHHHHYQQQIVYNASIGSHHQYYQHQHPSLTTMENESNSAGLVKSRHRSDFGKGCGGGALRPVNRYSNCSTLSAPGSHHPMMNTLSSPESAYSTGYSTDGTSPG